MRVIRGLGQGGMGAVWLVERALHGGLTQRAVVKRPRADLADGAARTPDALLQRFRGEARALARVSHGNVVRLLDAGADAHGPWIAIEHVDGLDAHALLEGLRTRGATITADELAWIAHEAARGMAAAHALLDADGEPSPVVHRDLSPQNLLLSCVGEVKVTDFGIAWAVDRETRTTTGVVVGNLRYIAPEQLEGRSVGPTTDVYGLGRVLEEFLEHTGDTPSRAALLAVAQRATRRAPDERHATMDDLCDALLDAVPTLPRGRLCLAARVAEATRARDRVHHALADLLAAEHPGNDRVSLPASTIAEAPTSTAAVDVVAMPHARPRRLPYALALSLTGALALVAWGAHTSRGPTNAPRHPPTPHVSTLVAVEPSAVRVAADASTTLEASPPRPPETPMPVLPPTPHVEPRHLAVHRDHASIVPLADASVQTPSSARATLQINSVPFARVSVDRGTIYTTPHVFELTAGHHHIHAQSTVDGGSVELDQDVELRDGETRTLGLTPR
jgi:serine/threonine protein kinase